MNKSLLLFALLATTPVAMATSLVYTPVNPSFGGNPANGTVLLNEANAQNGTHAPTKASTSANSTASKLTQFTNSLQTAILDKLSSAVESQIVGADGKLTPGTIDTSNFTIKVVDNHDGTVTVTTLDKTTNTTSSFYVTQS